MASSTIAIQFLRAVGNTVNAKGIDLAAVASGIVNPALLGHDQARVTGDQLVAVAQLLWQQTDDELFSLAPHPVARGTFRMLTLGGDPHTGSRYRVGATGRFHRDQYRRFGHPRR